MKILITGGAGFIGSNIVDDLISKGYEVCVIDNLTNGYLQNINKYAKFYKIDIRNKHDLEKIFKDFKPEIVSHHAAHIDVRKSYLNPTYDAINNIISSINVFFLCGKYKVRKVIFASSGGAIYGNPKRMPVSENCPLKPVSPYGISKFCSEVYLEYFRKIFNYERIVLRYSNVYGPRQYPFGASGVISKFGFNLLNNKPIEIYGDGKQTRDFIYIKDVVNANILSINGKEGIYNIGSGTETSINDLVKIFSRILNKKIEIIYKEKRDIEVNRIVLNINRAKKQLKFKPIYDLEIGIKQTLEWLRDLVLK